MILYDIIYMSFMIPIGPIILMFCSLRHQYIMHESIIILFIMYKTSRPMYNVVLYCNNNLSQHILK